ncbi:type VI secretion system tip protein VgrG, partial [Erwinia amylovora]|nr:type VI secretion system tip protein VgrG [Erwinia amylovora]
PQDSTESISAQEGNTTGEDCHYPDPFLTDGETENTDKGAYFARMRHERIQNGQSTVRAPSSIPVLAPAQVLEAETRQPDAVKDGILITNIR